MEVIEVKAVSLADNDNRPPDVHPIPFQTFDATISVEGHEEMLRMIREFEEE